MIKFLLGFFLVMISVQLSIAQVSKKEIKTFLKEQGEESIFQKQDSSRLLFTTLSGKVDVTVKDKKKSTSFSATLRLKKDSIWISVSPALGIEIARILILKDSIKILNKINATYFVSSFNHINELFQFDFDYPMIVDYIVGNAHLLYNHNCYKVVADKGNYEIATVNRIQLKKLVGKDRILQRYWVDPLSFRIHESWMNDFKENRKLSVAYSEFKELKGQQFAFKQLYEIDTKMSEEISPDIRSSKKPLLINIEFVKVSIDKELNLPFEIPEKYERIH